FQHHALRQRRITHGSHQKKDKRDKRKQNEIGALSCIGADMIPVGPFNESIYDFQKIFHDFISILNSSRSAFLSFSAMKREPSYNDSLFVFCGPGMPFLFFES